MFPPKVLPCGAYPRQNRSTTVQYRDTVIAAVVQRVREYKSSRVQEYSSAVAQECKTGVTSIGVPEYLVQ